ncbi:Transmembrane 9 superfamily member 7, partial [Diplonema papillatum]
MPGFLPYSAAFYEITLINRAIWQGQVYYVFTFLAIVIFVVTITISETVIVYIYHQLVFEDYRWWWKSFFVPTGMGVYMMLLSIHYYMTVLNVKTWLAAWLYFVFSSVLAIMTSIVAGSIG